MSTIAERINRISPLKKKVSWNVFGNVGGKILTPLFQVLIARQLVPQDYGVFGIAMAVTYAYDVVKDMGFTEAIIVGPSEKDISAQFTLQLITASIMFVLVVLAAPYFSIFYGDHRYITVLPLMGLIFFIKTFIDPLTTLYLKKQEFKILSLRQLVFPVVFGVVGYVLAKLNYGVYALILATVAAYFVVAIIFYVGKTESLRFGWDPIVKRKLFKLGKHVILQRISGYLVYSADSFTIGKILGMMGLGMYKISSHIANMLPNCIVGQTQQVLFTELSKRQFDDDYISYRYHHFTNMAGLFLVFYMLTVSMISPYLVTLIMGRQWGGIVPFIQIFSAGVIPAYLTSINMDISKIFGFASIYSKYAIIRSISTILLVTIMSFISLKAAACGWVFSNLCAAIVNDFIFYKKQNIIRNSRARVALFVFAWCWFIFIVIAIYLKPESLFFIINA